MIEYTNYEKDILRQMLQDISWEHSAHRDMQSDSFAWLIFKKIEFSLTQIILNRDQRYIALLNSLIPEQRGQEECDCNKGEGKCGCRVNAYNECVEQIDFAVELTKDVIEGKKTK